MTPSPGHSDPDDQTSTGAYPRLVPGFPMHGGFGTPGPDASMLAMFQLHRYQVLLHARTESGRWRFPEGYLYAVANNIHPYFHEHWCGEVDPYAGLYDVQRPFMAEVFGLLDDCLESGSSVPGFSQLEAHVGARQRADLFAVLRYAYHSGVYRPSVFDAIERDGEPAMVVGYLRAPLTDDDLALV